MTSGCVGGVLPPPVEGEAVPLSSFGGSSRPPVPPPSRPSLSSPESADSLGRSDCERPRSDVPSSPVRGAEE